MEESASAASLNQGQLCRICLRSGVDFLIINAHINLDERCESDDKVSFLDCLQYCTRLKDPPEFPAHICLQCSVGLQVAYNFIQAAKKAHEALRTKLNNSADGRSAEIFWKNESVPEENCNTDGSKTSSKMRFRCKLCNERLESKKALKAHFALHLDIISYCCKLCSFECKKRSKLREHYIKLHDTEATQDQLRAKTDVVKGELEVKQVDEIHLEMGQILNPPNSLGIEQQLEQSLIAIKDVATDLNSSVQSTQTIAASLTNDIKVVSDIQYEEVFNLIPPNEWRVANEFMIMADGTVEEIMGSGVTIEYINAAYDGVTLESSLVLNNVVQVEPTDVMQTIVNSIDNDVEDMIIEEAIDNELMPTITTSPQETIVQKNIEDALSPFICTTNSEIKCKLCLTKFPTAEQLKTHMLKHNEIPHFFCDQCAFYTFFKIDLTNHYHNEHQLQPTQMQLQPKNGEVKFYSCDMCLFETKNKDNLRRHYLRQHLEKATEIQLRPIIVDADSVYSQSVHIEAPPPRSPQTKQFNTLRPVYRKVLKSKKLPKTFSWRNNLRGRYKQHDIKPLNIKK